MRDGLKRHEFKWHVWDVLSNYGYHRDGCVIVLEHGTAALKPGEREVLARLSGGRITFRDSGIMGKAVHDGMFNGDGKGNFRLKALLEGMANRALHYASAALPGQTGGNARVDRPEQLHGLEKYAEHILKAMETVPENVRERLWLGGLSWNGYGRIYDAINRGIHDRTAHDIEG